MKLVVISFPEFFAHETEVVVQMMHLCPFTFHLRKPGASVNKVRCFLKAIPAELHQRVVLHQAHELAQEFNVQGIHYSTPLRPATLPLMSDRTISTSCHSVDEIRTLNKGYHSVFLSPLFPSISKHGYSGDLDWEEMSQLLTESDRPKVIALGGIDATRIAACTAAGFDGVAFLGAVWGADPQHDNSIVERFKHLISCTMSDLTV
jgi:thiamine-phosphate pyrophosphorylase